jgi:hypothetical protein
MFVRYGPWQRSRIQFEFDVPGNHAEMFVPGEERDAMMKGKSRDRGIR